MRRGSRKLLLLIGAPAAATTTLLWTRPEMQALLGCARPSVYPPGAPFASLAADLAANPTIFGKLLRDELPRTVYVRRSPFGPTPRRAAPPPPLGPSHSLFGYAS